MKLFLDDIRHPVDCVKYMHARIGKLNPIYLEQWEIARNFNQFKEWVEYCFQVGEELTHISFDHDLADVHYNPETQQESFAYDEKTGYDCAVWLRSFYLEKGLSLPVMFVHSMNPVGTQKIVDFFNTPVAG